MVIFVFSDFIVCIVLVMLVLMFLLVSVVLICLFFFNEGVLLVLLWMEERDFIFGVMRDWLMRVMVNDVWGRVKLIWVVICIIIIEFFLRYNIFNLIMEMRIFIIVFLLELCCVKLYMNMNNLIFRLFIV